MSIGYRMDLKYAEFLVRVPSYFICYVYFLGIMRILEDPYPTDSSNLHCGMNKLIFSWQKNKFHGSTDRRIPPLREPPSNGYL